MSVTKNQIQVKMATIGLIDKYALLLKDSGMSLEDKSVEDDIFLCIEAHHQLMDELRPMIESQNMLV